MDAKLQQAVDNLRAGHKIEAQKLLVEVVQENPEEVQGWYLLSLIVDSKEQQAAYAAKAVALNPDHEMAREHLAQLQTEPAAVTGATPDIIQQEMGYTLPDWLAQDEELVSMPAKSDTPSATEEELPDWVQEPISDSWGQPTTPSPIQEAPTTQSKTADSTAVQPTTAKPGKTRAKQTINRLDLILALLVIAVIIVVIFLFYLLTTS